MFRDGIFLAAFFALLILIAAKLDQVADSTVSGPFYTIDGDTLAVGSQRLRLVGLDAPEIDQTCEDDHKAKWACGQEARRALARLVSIADVECLGREYDRYRRLLVRCHAGTVSINAELVRRGLAIAAGHYSQEQVAAKRERQGIWVGRFDNPRDWRASRGMMDDPNLLADLMGWIKRKVAWE